MNIHEVKEVIRAAALANDTVIIEGKHGVGKSESAVQIAEEDNYHLETLFLSQQEVGDLIGSPHTITRDGVAITTWSIPIWLDRMNTAAKSGKKCMLFLDELNRAPLDVRQTAMQLVLEGKLHEHELPIVNNSRTLIVAACNPADDYQVDELDPALIDRFLFCEVEASAEIWLKWARMNKVNKIVRDFIALNTKLLHYTPKDGGIGASPRSWTKLGDHIDKFSEIPESIHFQIMKGKIGSHLAGQFYTFYQNRSSTISVKDIEKIVDEQSKKTNDIKKVAKIIQKTIKELEVIQKNEIAEQFFEKFKKNKSMSLLPLLSYLYALELEISISLLKKISKEEPEYLKAIVKLDNELTGKELFRSFFEASENK